MAYIPETITKPEVWDAMPDLPGAVLASASTIIYTGYLECDGSLLSRTVFAALFAVIGTIYGVGDGSTTFAIPDLRGEFIRGFDNGRGVDSGRAIGTTQADDNKAHTHPNSTSNNDTHNHTLKLRAEHGTGNGTYVEGVDSAFPNDNNAVSTTIVSDTHNHTTYTPSGGGGAEARPRNIAMMYCIKY